MTVVLLIYTGITDLANVKVALKDLNNWQSLGLELGLTYSTLNRIEEEQRGLIVKCKIEMLAAWLWQQDKVTKRGLPSWDVLKEALRNIGENKLARELKINGQDNVAAPPCDTLKETHRNIGKNMLARELKINGQDNVAAPPCDTLKETHRNIGKNTLARELKINGR